jgi:hypothetical protein
MARSIGDLGVRREPVDLEFRYFGSVIRVHPAASDTVELEFLDAGRDIDINALQGKDLAELDLDEKLAAVSTIGKAVRAGYLLIKSSLQQVIHPDDWPTYWRLAHENGQRIADLMADLKRITVAVVEADTGFPTMPPSASADGPETTRQSYAGASSSEPARHSSDADKALQMLTSRPDLQEFIVLQEEAEAAKARQKNAAGTAAARFAAVS